MKKPAFNLLRSFKILLLLAVIGSISFTSCNNAATSDPQPDAPAATVKLKKGDVYYITKSDAGHSIVKYDKGKTEVILTQEGAIYGLAVDKELNRIYWTNYNQNKIYYADPEMKDIRSFYAEKPYYIRMYNDKVYWTSLVEPTNIIYMAGRDGGEASQFLQDATVGTVRDIDFFTVGNSDRIYYTTDKGIKWKDLSSNVTAWEINGYTNFQGISIRPSSVDANTPVIYFTRYYSSKVYMADPYNNPAVAEIITNRGQGSITFNAEEQKLYYANKSNNLTSAAPDGSAKSVFLNTYVTIGDIVSVN